MYFLCFNDCLPNNGSPFNLNQCLVKSLTEYQLLKDQFPKEIDGIITSDLPSNTLLNEDGIKLSDLINGLVGPLKTIAYRSFTKYPFEDNFPIINDDDLIVNSYHISINGINYDATNARMVYDNNHILFTLAIHDDLKYNILKISDDNNVIVDVNNLFGETDNTNYIEKIIDDKISENDDNFEKLLKILGNHSISDKFKNSYYCVSENIQISINEHFESARNRSGPSLYYADRKLIKDVTPNGENIIKVYELRVFNPVACRIYFYEYQNKIYVASLEQKKNDKVQTIQINSASSKIKELINMDNKRE